MSTLIYVVDDEPLVCDLTRRMLERAGYRVQLMTNCTEATAGLRERLADLLLLDLSLPDGSGMQLCRQLKHAPATARVPIVILTGWSMPALRGEAIAAGAADLLAKPFSPSASCTSASRSSSRPRAVSGTQSGQDSTRPILENKCNCRSPTTIPSTIRCPDSYRPPLRRHRRLGSRRAQQNTCEQAS